MSNRYEKYIAARLRRAERMVQLLLEPTGEEREAGGKIKAREVVAKAREVVAKDGEGATIARAIQPESDDEVEP